MSANGTGGFCPRCLLEGVLDPESDAKAASGSGRRSDTESGSEAVPPPIRFGSYELLEVIGQGGSSIVWRARQLKPDRVVALKALLLGRSAGAKEIARFRQGAELAARLQHPNVLPIYEVGEHDGQSYFAMEYVSTGTLAERIRDGLPAKRAASYIKTIADGVNHFHERGIVHRDLKPSNVLVDAQDQPRITDFGLAMQLGSDSDLTATGQVLGSIAYMSPEQVRGEHDQLKFASDVYSLGATLYHLLTSRPPFVGESAEAILRQVLESEPVAPRKLNPSVPPDLDTICLKCLEKDPGRRYSSARDLAEDLARFLKDEPVKARPVGSVERGWRWCRRKPALAFALALCVFVAGVAATLWLQRQQAAVEYQRVRVSEAQERARLAVESEKRTQRETWISNMQLLRLGERRAGWSKKSWQLASNAAAIGVDEELKRQAAASLSGLDAHLITHVKDFAASGLAFAPGGEALLISAGASNHSRLWDATKGALVDLGHANQGPVAYRPDGTAVQFTVRDRTNVLLLEAYSGSTLMRFEAPRGVAGTVENPDLGLALLAMTPDASKVAAVLRWADGGREVIVWDSARPQPLWRWTNDQTTCVSLSPDGSCVGVGEQFGNLSVWSLGGRRIAWLSGDRTKVQSIAFAASPERRPKDDGEKENLLLAVGDDSGGLTIWDVRRQVLKSQCHGSYYDIYGLAFSADGMTLASAGRQSVRLWDVATGRQLLETEGIDHVAALAFSPDGTRLAACSAGAVWNRAQLSIWDIDYGRGVRTLHGLRAQITKVALSHDSRTAAALSLNWEVGVWDLAAHRLRYILKVLPGPSADNAALAFSPDDAQLVFSAGEELSVWDMATGQLVKRYGLPPGLGQTPVFDESGKLLLCRTETVDFVPPYGPLPASKHPRVCRIRDLSRTEWKAPVATIEKFNERVLDIRTPPDGRLFVVEGYQQVEGKRLHSIGAFDAVTAKELWSFQISGGFDASMCLDRGGQFVAFPTNAGTRSVVVELDTGRVVELLNARPSTLGPQATHWFALTAVGGMALFSKGGTNALLTVGIDAQHTDRPQLDSAWNLMLWGHVDGTASVYDLGAMRRQLNEIGAGW